MNKLLLQIKVIGTKGNIYTVSGINSILHDPFCNCKGFLIRGNCSHIEKIISNINKEFYAKIN